jgi:hypothetical protein
LLASLLEIEDAAQENPCHQKVDVNHHRHDYDREQTHRVRTGMSDGLIRVAGQFIDPISLLSA